MSESKSNNDDKQNSQIPDYCRYCHEEIDPCKECAVKIKEEERIHNLCNQRPGLMNCPCKLCKYYPEKIRTLEKEEWTHDIFTQTICCNDECLWHIHQSKHVLITQDIKKRLENRSNISTKWLFERWIFGQNGIPSAFNVNEAETKK
jgi:hypothetical protein